MSDFTVLLMIGVVVMFLILVILPEVISLTNRDQQVKSVSIKPFKPEIPMFTSTTIATVKHKRKPKAKVKPKAKAVSTKKPIKDKKGRK